MDKTQLMLLRAAAFAGLFLGVASCYGIILEIWLVFYKKLLYKGGITSYIILMVFGFGSAALAAFILILTEGNKL